MKQRTLSRRQAQWLELIADFDLHIQYVPGEDNTVADALSRKDLTDDVTMENVMRDAALTKIGASLSASVKQRIQEGYDVDSFCVALRKVLPLRKDCTESDGLLFVDEHLVIPEFGNV